MVAQAAYAAGEAGLSALTSDLIEVLKWPKPADRPGWLMIKHVLDALIRLDAKVPMETLARYEDEVTHSVLILAFRHEEAAHPLFRKTLRRSVRAGKIEAAGVAAGNALTAAKDRHVATLFLSHIEPVIDVVVVDHDRLELGGGGSWTGLHRDGWCTVPEGFPPYVWYELVFGPDPDGVLLSRGPVENVYYRRWVDHRSQFIIGFLSDRGDASEHAMGWAAALLDVELEGLPLSKRYSGIHRWRDADTLRAFVQLKRDEVRAGVATLTERLVKAGLLTTDERSKVEITPRVKIHDARDDTGVGLPELEDAGPGRR